MTPFADALRARLGSTGPPHAVLFDLDGTLIGTRRLYLESYRLALEPFIGRRLSDDEILTLKPRSEIRLLKSQVPDQVRDACFQAFYRHYAALHPTLFQGVYAEVPELLDRLRNAGRPLGIVTGKSRRAWEITSAHAPLGGFDVLVMDDDVDAAKPDPAGIRLALDRLRVSADRTVYVGDSISDIQAAARAGVVAVGVLWSKRGTDDRESFAVRAAAEGAILAATPAELAGACT